MTTIKVRNLNIPRLPYPLEKSRERMQCSEKILSRTFKDNDYSERCSCRNNQKLWGNGKVVNCCTWVSLFSSYFLGDAGHGWRNWSSLFCPTLPLFSYYMLDYTLNRHYLPICVGIVVDDSISSRRTCTDISR
jgi:hypothetical protein